MVSAATAPRGFFAVPIATPRGVLLFGCLGVCAPLLGLGSS